MIIHTLEEWTEVAYGLHLEIFQVQNGFLAYKPGPHHSVVGRFYPDLNFGQIDDDLFDKGLR